MKNNAKVLLSVSRDEPYYNLTYSYPPYSSVSYELTYNPLEDTINVISKDSVQAPSTSVDYT